MSTQAIVHPKMAKALVEKAIQPMLTAPMNFEKFGIKFLRFSFPQIDVEFDWHIHDMKIRFRMDASNYPYRPISGWWIDSVGNPLVAGSMNLPSGLGFHPASLDGTPGSWLCFKGWWEYHNHSGHQDVSWAYIRNESRYSILQLIMQLSRDLNNTGVGRV